MLSGARRKGIAAGIVRDVDPKILTYDILGLGNSAARWYRPDGRLSAGEIRDLFSGFAAEGWRDDRSNGGFGATGLDDRAAR